MLMQTPALFGARCQNKLAAMFKRDTYDHTLLMCQDTHACAWSLSVHISSPR